MALGLQLFEGDWGVVLEDGFTDYVLAVALNYGCVVDDKGCVLFFLRDWGAFVAMCEADLIEGTNSSGGL